MVELNRKSSAASAPRETYSHNGVEWLLLELNLTLVVMYCLCKLAGEDATFSEELSRLDTYSPDLWWWRSTLDRFIESIVDQSATILYYFTAQLLGHEQIMLTSSLAVLLCRPCVDRSTCYGDYVSRSDCKAASVRACSFRRIVKQCGGIRCHVICWDELCEEYVVQCQSVFRGVFISYRCVIW